MKRWVLLLLLSSIRFGKGEEVPYRVLSEFYGDATINGISLSLLHASTSTVELGGLRGKQACQKYSLVHKSSTPGTKSGAIDATLTFPRACRVDCRV